MSIIITVSRQLGAGGTQIASKVASMMDLRLIDRQILDRVAEQTGVPAGAVEAVDENPAAGKQRPKGTKPEAAELTYHQHIESAILEFTRKGDVLIIGRGAHLLLKDRRNMLRVKVMAPFDMRVASLMERLSLSKVAAEKAIRDSDRNRAEFFRKIYKTDWMDITTYDLVVNTTVIDYETAANMIVTAANSLREKQQKSIPAV